MNPKSTKKSAVARPLRRGMTILELLVVITIIAAMMSVMVPGLAAGRGEARVATCLNNLRGIALTASFYNQDYGRRTGSSAPVLPWHLGSEGYTGITYISEFVYGGFRHVTENPVFQNSDTFIIPTQDRPFNKYIAPYIIDPPGGRAAPIKQYVCPSDTWSATPPLPYPGYPPPEADRWGSWEVNGNSYPINWYWMQGTPHPDYMLESMHAYGSATLQKKTGVAACKFVVFMEAAMNAYMYDARPSDGSYGQSLLQQLGRGWHGRFSTYCMAMWDGHAEYSYVDTRYTDSPSHDIWPEPDTPWP